MSSWIAGDLQLEPLKEPYKQISTDTPPQADLDGR